MSLLLVPHDCLAAPALPAAASFAAEHAWWIATPDQTRPEQLAPYCTEIRTNTRDTSQIAAAITQLRTEPTDVILPACHPAAELGAAIAVQLQLPIFSSVLDLSDTTVTIVLGDRCFEFPRPAVGIYLIAAQPANPPLPAVVEWDSVELATDPSASPQVEQIALHPPDPEHIDLREAHRIVAAGIGCRTAAVVEELRAIGVKLGASLGATRVVTDAGWLPFERQIGTTGAMVSPELYLAFGISGAVQHLTGIGRPAHVITVNTDPAAPMMKFADLALEADAPATIAALARLLSVAAVGQDALPVETI